MKAIYYDHTDLVSHIATWMLPVYFLWFIFFVVKIYRGNK